MTAGGQLDLFAEQAAQEKADRLAPWVARFTRAPWVAPWDCSGGLRKGESVEGWVCPACGAVEINEFVLNLNHGYDPQRPDWWPGRGWAADGAGAGFGELCTRQILRRTQTHADDR